MVGFLERIETRSAVSGSSPGHPTPSAPHPGTVPGPRPRHAHAATRTRTQRDSTPMFLGGSVRSSQLPRAPSLVPTSRPAQDFCCDLGSALCPPSTPASGPLVASKERGSRSLEDWDPGARDGEREACAEDWIPQGGGSGDTKGAVHLVARGPRPPVWIQSGAAAVIGGPARAPPLPSSQAAGRSDGAGRPWPVCAQAGIQLS